eukprot:4007732-Pyramimonas_sp.AAC.1
MADAQSDRSTRGAPPQSRWVDSSVRPEVISEIWVKSRGWARLSQSAENVANVLKHKCAARPSLEAE